MAKPIPIISLFSGCGAFDLGFTRPGFEVLLALDNSPAAVATYNQNRSGDVAELADLSTMDSDSIVARLEQRCPGVKPRGVIGGPPCQFFSVGNVHLKPDDVRRVLPRRFGRLLKHLNGRYTLDFFVFENVRGIRSVKHREEFTEIKTLFEEAGFRLFEGVLDPVDFGVPQKRARVFLVGLNRDVYPDRSFLYPRGSPGAAGDVEQAIGHLPEPRFFERGLKPEDIPYHPNHWTMRPRSPKFTDGSLTPGGRQGRSFRVLDWHKPSWTVAYGNREIHIHPSGKRRLSVYEAMLLQGLPREYQLLGTLSEQIRQVSDAIPPQLGEALAVSLLPLLRGEEASHDVRDDSMRPSTWQLTLPSM